MEHFVREPQVERRVYKKRLESQIRQYLIPELKQNPPQKLVLFKRLELG